MELVLYYLSGVELKVIILPVISEK
jgi:hypothetical protein